MERAESALSIRPLFLIWTPPARDISDLKFVQKSTNLFETLIKLILQSLIDKTEEGSVSSDALRCLSLTMSSLFIYFGYNKAGSRSLNQG